MSYSYANLCFSNENTFFINSYLTDIFFENVIGIAGIGTQYNIVVFLLY